MDNPHDSPQSIDPLMRLWKRRKWLALGVFCLIFIPGIVFLWSLPQIYAASATLTIPGAGGTSRMNQVTTFDVPLAVVSERVLSRQNLSTIITEMNLFPDKPADKSGKQLADSMRKHIAISTQRTNGPGNHDRVYAFSVTYSNWKPQTAAAVANRLARSYQTTAGQMQAAQARQTAEALAARMSEVGKKLDKQRARVNGYQKKHLGGLPQQQQALLATISRLNSHLQTIQARELSVIGRRDKLLDQTAKSGGGSLAELRQQLRQLRTTYTSQYPEVKQLKQRIAVLERQQSLQAAGAVGSFSSDELGQANSQLRNLRESESATRAKIQGYQKKLNMLPVTNQELETLRQGYSATSGVYSALLKLYEQARVAAATMKSTNSPYRILEPATAMGGPVGPKRLRFAIALLILSIIIGVGAAYIGERRDTTFHSLEELRAFTAVPVLATVPFIRDGRWHPLRAARAKSPAALVVVGVFLLSVIAYAAAYGGLAVSLALTHHGG